MQQILKSNSKEKDEDKSEQSWWKKNKRRKPVKYDIQSLFSKSGLDKDSFKWYYPDPKTREKTTETYSSSFTKPSTEDPAMLRSEIITETTARTTTTTPSAAGTYISYT